MTSLVPILALLTSTAQINALSQEQFADNLPLTLTGTVTRILYGNHFILADETGQTHIRNLSAVRPACGDRIVLEGFTGIDAYWQEQSHAQRIDIVGSSGVPEPTPATIPDIAAGRHDFKTVVAEAFVTAAFRDDIDANWLYLTLEADGAFVYATLPRTESQALFPERLNRSYIRFKGAVVPNHCGIRRFIGPHVELSGGDDLEILKAPENTGDPCQIPTDVNRLSPAAIVRLGLRTLDGQVLCRWGEGSVLLFSRNGQFHRVDLSEGVALPPVAAFVRASGFPETDLIHLNLSDADCVPIAGWTPPLRIRGDTREIQDHTQPNWQRIFHGADLVLSGRVREEAHPSNGNRVVIESSGQCFLFDVSTVPELAERLKLDALVTVSGCGLAESENWRPGAKFPSQNNLLLVARTPDDLIRIKNPPWWTPGRLFGVVLSLLASLFAVLAWNRILARLVERKGKLLYREELAHAAAVSRTQERTRLAVELHDALSQTLTGIACQIDIAHRLCTKDPSRVPPTLTLAGRMITRCRNELKNCLSDLRNRSLEETDVDNAIRRTLFPLVGDIDLQVHCDIVRSRVPDTVFHDILCIVRELATNAVRHGKARQVTVTGTPEGDGFRLTVRDDGCGFDADNHPGPTEGHFGLLGISERLERLGGSLIIDAAPGRGTSVTITIRKLT